MAELILLATAGRFIETLDDLDKEAVYRILRSIAADPAEDDILKLAYPLPPLIARIYNDGQFKVIYFTSGNVVRIWGISYADEQPRLRSDP